MLSAMEHRGAARLYPYLGGQEKYSMGGMVWRTKSMLGLLGLRSEQELAKRKETVCQAEGRAGS